MTEYESTQVRRAETASGHEYVLLVPVEGRAPQAIATCDSEGDANLIAELLRSHGARQIPTTGPMTDSDRPEPVWDSWAGEHPQLHYWPDTLTTADVALLAEHGVGSPLTLATLPGGRLGALSEATGIPAERLRPVIPGVSPELVEKMWDPAVDGWVPMPAVDSSAVPAGVPAASDPGFMLALTAASTNADVDVIVSLADEVTRLTARASQVEGAARRLLDGCTPQVSALELEHGVDADALYGDLAEALGLSRDRRPEDR